MSFNRQLIFGGARSGKSRLAEQLTAACGSQVTYIATADSRFHDDEMRARVAHHRQQRPSHWSTQEEPLQLASALRKASEHSDAIMIDCLTLWLTNCLLAEENEPGIWQQQKQAFLAQLGETRVPTFIVSNEVGMGIVPLGELNRRFVDEAGWLNQAVAAACERVIFTAAGLPLVLKGAPLQSYST
ncbi:bifunctional adenosylcobinamide kinase/adenosylcobinamide-phosphate guanylyltransferase [Pseudomaricurvus sp. HS19]|uniref:bifunctional adenosylcobinamide kinase/adenosylcobinamide-phosphate guanylyltransferase n=1 Tax=Pseudomaricurvus sp. HS19 TaxID=2692626 RepID=UPI00136F040A|nr:bifunctional adenosylcobinamide kinase/adenosylcobinamide-phosphate guanylyltransferase [Pseudomaricurvus sp. HS19]MYM63150.1 bifunctional adenosylcobinamide kinase/adenosylcobinamide-phosphate guanylyltransferase [Pseudomaricurvus sp. HS19]